MKASKFTEAQKAFVLKQGEEGTPVAELGREHGMSTASFYKMARSMAAWRLLCPLETGPFETGVFGYPSLAGRGAENDEGIEVHRGAEAVILKQGEEGTPVAEICRRAGIREVASFT